MGVINLCRNCVVISRTFKIVLFHLKMTLRTSGEDKKRVCWSQVSPEGVALTVSLLSRRSRTPRSSTSSGRHNLRHMTESGPRPARSVCSSSPAFPYSGAGGAGGPAISRSLSEGNIKTSAPALRKHESHPLGETDAREEAGT